MSGSQSGSDRRPRVEKDKGGVKLFVGRLPREVTDKMLRVAFEEFGEVLEVFIIDSRARQHGCAFVRLGSLEAAENAIEDLHEQRILIPELRELGPMQVAFAKGEAKRLGLNEDEETLPSFYEARMKVIEHQEKRLFFESLANNQPTVQNCALLSHEDLVALTKAGQRNGGQQVRDKWHAFCDQGVDGQSHRDPYHHPQQGLVHFTQMMAYEHGQQEWFKAFFNHLPNGGLMAAHPAAGMFPGGPGMPGMPGIPGMPPMPALPGIPGLPPGPDHDKGYDKGKGKGKWDKGKGKDKGKDKGKGKGKWKGKYDHDRGGPRDSDGYRGSGPHDRPKKDGEDSGSEVNLGDIDMDDI